MLGEYAKRPTDPGHPIGFSDVDRSAIASLAATIGPILEGPFGAAVVHTESCAAVVVEEGGLAPIERIASVGRSLRILSPARSVLRRRTTDVPGLDDRQRDALGTVHDLLAQLDVAVVGVGGTGSPVAEQLVRMGAGSVTIVDGDPLDTPSNVRRVVGSVLADLRGSSPPRKVDVVGRHLDQLGLGDPARRVFGDVRGEANFREIAAVIGTTPSAEHLDRPALGRPPRRRGAVKAPAVKADRQDVEMERLVGGEDAPQDRAWAQNL